MATISIKCTSCKAVLKLSADKAGRKVRCSKCNAAVAVPKEEKDEKTEKEKEKETPPAPPEPPKPAGDDDDDGKAYGVSEIIAEVAQVKEEKKKAAKPKAKIKRKYKTISDPELWEKVRAGMMILVGGIGAWGLAELLQFVVVIIGLFSGPQYNEVVEKNLFPKDAPAWKVGESMPLDRTSFLLGLVAGADNAGLARTLLILAAVFFLVAEGIYLVGYIVCLPVPERFGTKVQLSVLLGLAGTNLVLTLVLRLLPLLGVIGPIAPLLASEASMGLPNMNRFVPLHVFWSAAPFWEMLLTILYYMLFFIEPVILACFLQSAGLSMRDDIVEQDASALMQLGLGQAFILLAYLLISIAGSSEVLGYLLRVVYVLWACFLAGYIIRFALVLMKSQATLEKYIHPPTDEEGQDEDEDEDKNDKKKKKEEKPKKALAKKKKRKYEDEVDEDDED